MLSADTIFLIKVLSIKWHFCLLDSGVKMHHFLLSR